MLTLLDPALFALPSPTSPEAEKAALANRLNDAVRICRACGGVVPKNTPYWSRLQTELVRPLEKALGRAVTSATDSLRALPPWSGAPAAIPEAAQVWGMRDLFGWSGLSSGWEDLITRVLLASIAAGEPTLLITRLIEGRNAKTHTAQGVDLLEKTRWRLMVRPAGMSITSFPCISTPRNLALPWTARFDDRLPAAADGAKYPFCPPMPWHRRGTLAFKTSNSRPAWLDANGNAWARPGTGGGYHWDVYLNSDQFRRAVGLFQINVSQWPPVKGQPVPGELHHVPAGKRGRLKVNSGWKCQP